jgi:hypothetical protein
MEATRSSEMSGTTQRTTRRHIPEEDTLQNHRCENLKSYSEILNAQMLGLLLGPEDEGINFLRNVCKLLSDYTTSHISRHSHNGENIKTILSLNTQANEHCSGSVLETKVPGHRLRLQTFFSFSYFEGLNWGP